MGVGKDSLRHIERGRRPLPDFLHGRIKWVRQYLTCISATADEEKEALSLATHSFVEQFADWLRDLENQQHHNTGAEDDSF